MAEFKIGRLRYTWKGQWAIGTFYNRDAVVQHEGKSYVCLVAHTSANFDNELAFVTPSGASTPYWVKMLDGTSWKGQYTPGIFYTVGNLVVNGGTVFQCTVSHTASAVLNPSNWTIGVTAGNYQGPWSINSSYGIGDQVKYGGIVYQCILGHVSAATVSLGLEADQAKWTVAFSGIEYKSDWTSATSYKLNDLVKESGSLWIATTSHTSLTTFDPTNWSLWVPGQEYRNVWASTEVYELGDVVKYGGYSYVSNTSTNINNIPSANASVNWTLLSLGYDFKGDWSTTVQYKVGDVIRRGGRVFTAIQDNTSQDPSGAVVTANYVTAGSSGTTVVLSSNIDVRVGMLIVGTGFSQRQTVTAVDIDGVTITISEPPNGIPPLNGNVIKFTGINATYWKFVTSGVSWKNQWIESGEIYSIGDLVVYQNATYICVANHQSSTVLSPEADSNFETWQIYLYHARKNASDTVGDIVTFNGTENTPIRVPVPGPNNPLVDEVFAVSNSLPSWRKINVVPKVFYVTPNGIDDPNYGTTWDRPWGSIRYACETIQAGFNFQEATELMLQNRSYIQEEVWNYIEYQIAQGTPPFNANPVLDEGKTKRDAGYIIDAIAYDLKRGGNSQTVAATLAYFASEPGEKFITPGTAAAMPYFILALQELDGILNRVLQNSPSLISYQTLNNIPLISQVGQVVDNQLSVEAGTTTAVVNLLNIVITSLTDQDVDALPPVNQGITCTVMVRTGTYFESLPIVVPANTAINGDELRGAVVRPQRAINTIALSTDAVSNRIRLLSYQDLTVGDPVQFSGTVLEMFGGLVSGVTYYVIDVDINLGIIISNAPSSTARAVTAGIGKMKVYGGDALKDMFRVRDGTGIRNMTLSGLLGSLTELNQYETRRPTGGTFVALDPGTGPDDSSAWIIRRSPYIQNVTTFGKGAVGNKIDGTLHNGGNHSMVSNDFTQIISDGIGVWCTGPGSLTELVSVFSYYNYAGYMAENGGRIRATNGNTSYGSYGVIAEGFDGTEIPIQGTVFNQSSQVQANVQSSFGQNSQIVSLNFANAGSGYNTTTTNLLLHSNQLNDLATWTLTSTSLQQNVTAPNNYAEGWTLSGLSSAPGADYISQQISIQPAGVVYTSVPATNINGSGASATFDVTVTSTGYTVIVNSGGNGYVSGNQLLIAGGVLGGLNNVNDCILTIVSLSGSSILSVTNTGVAPNNSNLSYTLSIYAKQGTATSFDLQGVFAGTTTVTSGINYNFSTDTITPYGLSSGFVPTQYGRIPLDNGWYRVWVAINDITAQNNSLQFKLLPRGINGTISNNYFYGTQVELSASTFAPSFYLETTDILYTSYANYKVVGAGSGALLIGNEIRSGAIFQTRVTDPGTGPGGSGYLTASNASQLGDPTYIQLAGSNTNTASELIGMRVFINSGTGAGQFGYISAFNETTKVASILKESFDALEITASSSADNSLTIGPSNNTTELYITQPVQFLPKSYTNSVQSTAVDGIVVTATLGGLINTFTVASTDRLRRNMEVTFTGNVFGGVTQNFIYYISEILSATTFQVSTSFGGTTWQLLTATPGLGAMLVSFPTNDGFVNGSTTNMVANMPIQFTGASTGGIVVGTTYYVNDIIDANTFSISTSLNELTVTATTSGSNTLTTGDTSVLTLFNPIIFKSGIVGGLTKDTKYYISNITSSVNFQIVSNVITTTARLTEIGSNLITVDSTLGFIANNPIKFIGTSFGEIVSERIYYILAINDATTFTISATPGGSSINLTGQLGELTVKTTPTALTVSVSTGATMTGATTSSKRLVTAGYGHMIGTYTTSIYGNVVSGTTYYIRSINSSSNSITLSASSGGPIFNLVSESSAMIMGEVGWDHVNPGTPIASVLDSSSVYFVEPRTTFTRPGFSQTTSTSAVVLAPGTIWQKVTYGANSWMALPDGGLTAAFSTNGSTWVSRVLPDNRVWTDLAYGRGYWVAISSGGTGNSKAIYSKSNGIGWRTSNLPSATTWSNISYGNGKFVAIASGTATSAYSVDNGATWLSGSSLPNATWTSLCYGNGVFVAIASGGTQSAYSVDGINWVSGTLPGVAAWSSITYGNGRFMAISSTSAFPAYSFDGITWYSSPLLAFGSVVSYGQGVFLVVRQGNSTAYTTEDGIHWKQRTVASATYNTVAFGFAASTFVGRFVTLVGQSSASIILAGSTAKARPVITSGTITSIIMFEPGSNYITTPTVTFTDPNVTTLATVDARIGNGSLANPTFRNRGINYNTTSTAVTIIGNGYADAFQTGLTIILKDLTRLPQPGDNLSIDGVNVSYKVTSAVAKFGTLPPSIEANIQIAPDLKVLDSPPNGTNVTIRQKYSQVRLTGHDFLNVGYGNQIEANYPGLPVDTLLAPQDQAVEVNFGRVFYTSTDQDGNFKVGSLFAVEQSTGIITISASQFGLQGLETLSLGGISVGGQSVIIRQFSTDSTFVANSNEILSTQKAIKAYLTGRLSQGGSNTFTGQLTAGTVIIGGSDKISSTIPEGTLGSNVKMLNKVLIDGAGGNSGYGGDGAAMAYFMKTWNRR